jgi:PfaD family protein
VVDPDALGSAAFRAAHGVRRSYVAGAMAGGIASVRLVSAMRSAGYLSFFGAGGLPLDAVEAAVAELSQGAPPDCWGANLLHNPAEPAVEDATVDLYLRHGVRRVEASAFMTLTPAIVRYRVGGLRARPDGTIEIHHKVMAKVSRTEVASRFLQPPPEDVVRELLAANAIDTWQATLARHVPMADDVTGEADSGGHTDHRPLVVLLPILLALRDRVDAEHGYARRGVRPRIGAAGGLGTPSALWAAFAMGADYVLTGSVNQAAVESGTSDAVRRLLADLAFHDVATGPAPDMFEIGAKVQVVGRGALYAQRAQKLYDIYKRYDALEDIPDDERTRLETQILRRPVADVWDECVRYWGARDPGQLERAEADPRHRMALVFRWYLGMTSRWARVGEEDRKRDFQIWCGPAMGAFNAWAAGGPFADPSARTVVAIADALMEGAAVEARRAVARAIQAA